MMYNYKNLAMFYTAILQQLFYHEIVSGDRIISRWICSGRDTYIASCIVDTNSLSVDFTSTQIQILYIYCTVLCPTTVTFVT